MADTSISGGPANIASTGPNEEPSSSHSLTTHATQSPLSDVTDRLTLTTHTDKDRLAVDSAPMTITTTTSSSNANSNSNSTVSTTTSAKRVTMDGGDVDGAPSTNLPDVMNTSISSSTIGLDSPRGRSRENGCPDDGGGGSGGGRGKDLASGSKGSHSSSSAESTPRRSARARSANPPPSHGRDKLAGGDMSGLDMKMSWDGSATSGGGAAAAAIAKAGMLADPVKIAKEREKEERVRQAREKLEHERRKKLLELKEQQRLAQENRDKQLEMRRQKIEDLRRRDTERRAAVEERRKMKEEIERIRRESILIKAEERVARYEAWKAGGRKGRTSGGVPSYSANTPTSSYLHPGVKWSPVRIRERSSPRKQRPSSVASSMPSFVGAEPAKTPRSKSSDRTSRDRSKHRLSRKEEKTPRESLAKVKDEADDDDNKDSTDGTTKKNRVSLSFFDRLSTPKFSRGQNEQNKDATTPKRDAPIIRKSSLKEKSIKDTTSKHSPSPSLTAREPRVQSPKVAATGGLSSPSVKSTSSPRRTPPPPAATASPQHTATAPTNGAGPQAGAAGGGGGSEDGTTGPRGINADITEVAYKAKMAERRRQAREKAEKEAEEEKKRQEEARLEEERQMLVEEEQQQRLEEESNRLAQEARKAEEERLQKAIEAEDKRKEEEAERLEQERKAKEETERKAKEESERLEKEKQERARKEEEERQQRKKKLEMIMKRVKTDPAATDTSSQKSDSPTKSIGNSPNRSMVSSPDGQERPPFPQTTEVSSVPDADHKDDEMSTSTTEQRGTDIPTAVPVTRSASSGDILDGASAHDEAMEREKEELTMTTSMSDDTPSIKSDEDGNSLTTEQSTDSSKSRFKSPLLQQLVENKGNDTQPGTSPKFKSPLLQNLLGKTKVGARIGLSSSLNDLSLNKPSSPATSSSTATPNGSTKEISQQSHDEDKDEDESVAVHTHSIRDDSATSPLGGHMTNGTALTTTKSLEIAEAAESSSGREKQVSPLSSGMNDSALGASMTQSLYLANGHGKEADNNGLQDSSISLHSVDDGSVVPSRTSGYTFDQQQQQQTANTLSSGDGQFEEIIDLLDSPGNSKAGAVLSSGSTPIIAFEENNRMADVSESLS